MNARGLPLVVFAVVVAFWLGWLLRPVPEAAAPAHVPLPNRTVDLVSSGFSTDLEQRLRQPGTEPVPVVVVLNEAFSPAQDETLRAAGLDLGRSLGRGAFFATIDGARASDVADFVQSADLRRPEDTVAHALWERIEDPAAAAEPIPVSVHTVFGLPETKTRELLGRGARPYGPLYTWRTQLTPDEIRELAVDAGILWIEGIVTSPTPLFAP